MPTALMSFQHPDSAAPLTRYISPTPSSRFRLPGDTISGALTGQPHSMIRPAPAPHPLGKKGVSFPFTSATPHDQEQTAHESGWRVSIHLNREGRGEEGEDAASRWRTGEALNGAVEVKKIEGSTTHKKITSVIVRAYWQSTTFYHMVSVVQPEGGTKSKKSSLLGSKPNVRMDHRAEWHRGYCNGGGEGTELWHGGELEEIQREVEGDFPLLDASTAATTTASSATGTSADATASPRSADGEAEDDIPSRTTLPFNFTIPTSTRVTVSNVSPQPPATRRSLQLFQRTPPASLPGSACRNGCVEWTVEVLVRFESDEVPTPSSSGSISPPFPRAVDELPSFDSATNAATELSDNFGLARTGPNLIAHRIVFPYEPSDHHAMDLYSHWRPVVKGPWAAVTAKFAGIPLDEIEDTRPVLGVVVPSFGRDPRDEALGGTFMGPKRPMRGLYVEREGGRSRWSSFEKRKGLKNVLGRLMGHIRSEISMPYPALVTRHSSHLPLILHLGYVVPATTAPKALAKLKPVQIQKVLAIISARTMTRGGKEDRPHFILEEIRRDEIMLWEDQAARREGTIRSGEDDATRQHLTLVPGTHGHDLKLEFDLQSDSRNGKEQTPLKDCSLSLRAPNLEREYILSVMIYLSGGNEDGFYALRAPFQLIAGDLDAPPQFSFNMAIPPPSSPNNGLPSYGA